MPDLSRQSVLSRKHRHPVPYKTMSDLLSNQNSSVQNDHIGLFETTVSGEVIQVLFSSDDQQYAVLRFVDAKGDESTLCGPLGHIREGQEIEAKGKWENHRQYGRQFRVSDIKEVLPTTSYGIKRYLECGILPGIGPKLAERIVDKFGEDTLKILDNYSTRLVEVDGIGKGRIGQIRDAWRSQQERRNDHIFLQGLGISRAYCNRVFKAYGADAPTVVKENPFRLANEVKGIGFSMADGIARKLDIAKDNPFRLGAGIVYVLSQLTDRSGHTFYPKVDLLEKAADILDVSAEVAGIGLERAIVDGAVIADKDFIVRADETIYPTSLYRAETELAELISRRSSTKVQKIIDLSRYTSAEWLKLNTLQQEAVTNAFNNSLSIITGGPGVGKTTATREIVAIANKYNISVGLSAPTGRASKRLSQSSGHPAQTIHRLLKWQPEKGGFFHNTQRPLDLGLLVVDEVSMLDISLAHHLFQALSLGTRVVLIGDKDQLPSIGPGLFLSDLISCDCVAVTHLIDIYRQSKNSRIIDNAYKVNVGKLPDISKRPTDEISEFYWISQEDPDRVVDLICRMVSERIPDRFNLSPINDIQVLSPMNRGSCGAVRLNQQLQTIINPAAEGEGNEVQFGETVFRPNDRVMQARNNYDLNIFNGDLGIVKQIDSEGKLLYVSFDNSEVAYPFDDMDQLRLAYATTIHKSQGSEFPAVILPVISQHYIMLKRNLIYTAMTRASKLLIMIGSTKALKMAIDNYKLTPRYTQLARRITALKHTASSTISG